MSEQEQGERVADVVCQELELVAKHPDMLVAAASRCRSTILMYGRYERCMTAAATPHPPEQPVPHAGDGEGRAS